MGIGNDWVAYDLEHGEADDYEDGLDWGDPDDEDE